ncbi:MAG: cytochrome c biogenesis protein CcdA [Chloroflexi bacterium]|nr:cytochrome c biogenesis protein CcdA [Chloroflexota bacterium]
MVEAPLGFAFLAGMAALWNPCGVAMLPAYIGYQLSQSAVSANPVQAVAQGTLLGGGATLGFVALFGSIGAVIALGGRAVITAMPYAGLAVGIGVVGLAIWLLLSRKHLGLLIASRVQIGQGKGVFGFFLFGLGYGLCSLSCALPIFLVVVVGSLAVGGFAAALGGFLSYALGMGAMLLMISWAVATSQAAARRWILKGMPYVERVGNLVLLGAGTYIVYYWTLGTGGKQFLFS